MPEYIYIYNVGFHYATFCHFDVGNFITHHVQAPPPGRPHSVASPLPGSQWNAEIPMVSFRGCLMCFIGEGIMTFDHAN